MEKVFRHLMNGSVYVPVSGSLISLNGNVSVEKIAAFTVENGKVHMAVEKYMAQNKKNNVLKKRDFERYEILLPFSAAAGKRKKQYLCSELEKRHPCFSDEFAFDSSLKKIRKNGLSESVFVVNKYKLAEYEGRRHFSGIGFFTEDNVRRRLFVKTRWRLSYCAAVICLIILLTGSVYRVFMNVLKNSKESGKTELVDNSDMNGISDNSGASDVSVCPAEIILLETVAQGDGKIIRFEWRIEGFSQITRATVKGLFPEKLNSSMGGVEGAVVYENGIPKTNVSYSTPFPQQNKSGLASPNTAALRKIICEAGGILKEEKTSPYHVEFVCNLREKSKSRKLFESLAEIIEREGCLVSFLSVNQTGAEELRVGLSLDSIPVAAGFDLRLISDNLSLFSEETEPSSVPVFATTKPSAIQKNDQIPNHKIGVIKKSDNSSVVFYKTPEGKLEKIIHMEESQK